MIAALVLLGLLGHWLVNAPPPVTAAETERAAPAAFSPDQKKEDPADRQELSRRQSGDLRRHPECARKEKVKKEQAEKLKVAIAENATEIYRAREASVAGNPDGEITVVEFFDYNCGYCKHGLHDVVKLVETDPKVRVVFKELPILSKGSEEGAVTLTLGVGPAMNCRCTMSHIIATAFQPRSSSMPCGCISDFL